MGKIKGQWNPKPSKGSIWRALQNSKRNGEGGKVTGYTSNGMPGFTENGPDEGFDLALGTVRGYRWWTWQVPARLVGYLGSPPTPEFGKLTGAYGCAWDDGKAEARCAASVLTWQQLIAGDTDGHQVPEYRTTCGCGFWAYWPPYSPSPFGGTLKSGAGPFALPDNHAVINLPVFGSVTASGRVILGEKGFRAQYAQIESLCLPQDAIDMIGWWVAPVPPPRLMRDYGVTAKPGCTEADPRSSRADSAEVVARAAMLEAALEARYPSARVLSSQEILTRVFPPDSSYYKPEPPLRYPQF